jgi:CubicO group peptidase (beta-lactamase class C family)
MRNIIEQIDAFATNALVDWHVPGAAIGIVHNRQVIHLKGYGQKGLTNPDPITPSTLFPIASISKGMSAAAIAVLVEQGHLHWHQKVIELLPHFKMYDSWVTKEFTVADLFSHRSGLPFDPMQQLPLWGYSVQDLKNSLPLIPPFTSFRTTYQYINILYLLVEDIVAHLTNMPFAEFMSTHVFKPIGMDNARVGFKAGPQTQGYEHLIQGHILDEETYSTVQQIPFSSYPQIYLAAGGVVASPNDLCRWMLTQLGHIPFLPMARLRYMWRPQTVISDTEFYGLGWRSLTHKPHRIISHGGLIKGIRHLLYLVPDSNFGIFVLTSLTHNEAPHKICEYATDLIMGLKPTEYDSKARDAYLKELKLNCPPSVQNIAYEPSEYTGEYTNPILGKGVVAYDESTLKLYLGTKPAIALLEPIAAKQFRLFFIGDSGADIGEGHWGTATFEGQTMVLKGYQRFDVEEFRFEKR